MEAYFTIQDTPVILLEDQTWLQRNFDEEEILESIKSCAIDKAPRPYGFPMNFYLNFWDLIKGAIMGTLQYFYDCQVFERSLNTTYVALIPKKTGVVELRDFRPISLISGVYKILATTLAERMKRVIGKLINRHQMAFIKGGQIMDAALIASVLIVDTRIKGKVAGLMCAIEKAFGHVNWNYLLNMLTQMGFGNRRLKQISFFIKTVWFSILVNGEPVGFLPS